MISALSIEKKEGYSGQISENGGRGKETQARKITNLKLFFLS